MAQICERCNFRVRGYIQLDYCAECSKNLCEKCMEEGCCGSVPAKSGMDEDYGEDEEDIWYV